MVQHTAIFDLSNDAIFNDRERPLYPQFQGHAIFLTLNISETVRHTDIFNEIVIRTYTRLTQQCHFE